MLDPGVQGGRRRQDESYVPIKSIKYRETRPPIGVGSETTLQEPN